MPTVTKRCFPSVSLAGRCSRGLGLTLAFAGNQTGATSIEYSLLASLIAVTIAGICSMMFDKLSTEYSEISNIFS